MRIKRRKRKGFTIIELIVVAVILSMLAALLVPKIGSKFGRAKHEIAKSKLRIIEQALETFRLDCGRFPTEAEGLEALVVAPADLEEKWTEPYAKQSEILDPWDNTYIYIEEGVVNPGSYDLISFGADGQEGGEDEDEDIFND
ncbi:MAG: type II secretion system major pseudopilin GspG [Anaerohalosphaera sp.]|nr:type II secretion system major pseudopilin GspG [Anaerohalosphaera sp.]